MSDNITCEINKLHRCARTGLCETTTCLLSFARPKRGEEIPLIYGNFGGIST